MQQSSINAYCLMNEAWFYCGRNREEEGLLRDLPGSPVVETRRSHCRGTGLIPWGTEPARAAEHDRNRKGGANTNPEPRSSDAKSTVLAHTACCLGFSSGVSTQRYHLLGSWKHPSESRDSPPPCKPAAPWGPPWGLHPGKSDHYKGHMQLSSTAIYTYIFQNGNYVILMIIKMDIHL